MARKFKVRRGEVEHRTVFPFRRWDVRAPDLFGTPVASFQNWRDAVWYAALCTKVEANLIGQIKLLPKDSATSKEKA